MLDLTLDELKALRSRLCRPLALRDIDEAGLSAAVRAYRLEENHYRTAVEKIERAADASHEPD